MPNQTVRESATIGRTIEKTPSKSDRATPNILAHEERLYSLENAVEGILVVDSTQNVRIQSHFDSTDAHGANVNAIGSTIALRDSTGNINVALVPTSANHAASKSFVESLISNGLGVAQTWQNVTASRAKGVVYTNNTGRPIFVSVGVHSWPGGSLWVNGIQVDFLASVDNNRPEYLALQAIVPAGATYTIDASIQAVHFWSELR